MNWEVVIVHLHFEVCKACFFAQRAKEFNLLAVSDKLDVIVDYVLHDLHSGATLNEIIGAYDNTPRKEMIAIVDKQEYRRLMEFVRKTDPTAFVTVYSVSEMRYTPKK